MVLKSSSSSPGASLTAPVTLSGGHVVSQPALHTLLPPLSALNAYKVRPCASTRVSSPSDFLATATVKVPDAAALDDVVAAAVVVVAELLAPALSSSSPPQAASTNAPTASGTSSRTPRRSIIGPPPSSPGGIRSRPRTGSRRVN